jgi:hypothetical protein
VFARVQLRLFGAGHVQEHTSQTESCGPALVKPELDESALAGENFGRKFATVFSGHRSLDAFHDR